MSGITTHVLDLALGAPARGMPVRLEMLRGKSGWTVLGEGVTDDDGRARDLAPAGTPIEAGLYRLTFMTGLYHRSNDMRGFYPEVIVTFEVSDPARHHHVPLLLSPWGYSTYRGS